MTLLGFGALLASPAAVALAAPPADSALAPVPTATVRTATTPTVANDAPIADALRLFARDLRTDRRLDRKKREARAAPEVATAGPTGALAAIAQCESGGNPRAIGGGGTYRGLYQFSYATWAAVGGSGDPAQASVAEQTKRAQILYDTAGPSQWPICGQ